MPLTLHAEGGRWHHQALRRRTNIDYPAASDHGNNLKIFGSAIKKRSVQDHIVRVKDVQYRDREDKQAPWDSRST